MKSLLFKVVPIIMLVGAVGVVFSRSNAPSELTSKTVEPAAISAACEAIAAAVPKVAVNEPTFDIGIVDVGDVRKHRFRIENTGTAELTLKEIDTSCKCTTAKLGASTIAPGQWSFVDVEWAPFKADDHFSQGVRYTTNDPDMPELRLVGTGTVTSRMGIWPDDIYIQDVPRNGKQSMNVLLYSQHFKDVKVTKIESSLPNVDTSLAEVDSSVGEVKATWVRDLTLTYRADDTVGPFQGTIRVYYEVAGEKAERLDSPFEFTFVGETVGEISIQGRQVVGKLLKLGTITASIGTKAQAYIYIRGDASKVSLALKEKQPAFLGVKIGARQKLSDKMTRFPIEVEVPPGSPDSNLDSEESGQGAIELTTTHPRYPTIRFPVSLVVAP